jgi:hypothetical protein
LKDDFLCDAAPGHRDGREDERDDVPPVVDGGVCEGRGDDEGDAEEHADTPDIVDSVVPLLEHQDGQEEGRRDPALLDEGDELPLDRLLTRRDQKEKAPASGGGRVKRASGEGG